MDPFTLTAIAIGKLLLGKGAAVGAAKVVGYSAMAGAATATVTGIAVAYWDNIKSWFEKRKHSHRIDNVNVVARTIKESMSNGNCRIIKQVFNKKTNTCIDSESQEYKQLGPVLAEKHCGKRIVEHRI